MLIFNYSTLWLKHVLFMSHTQRSLSCGATGISIQLISTFFWWSPVNVLIKKIHKNIYILVLFTFCRMLNLLLSAHISEQCCICQPFSCPCFLIFLHLLGFIPNAELRYGSFILWQNRPEAPRMCVITFITPSEWSAWENLFSCFDLRVKCL